VTADPIAHLDFTPGPTQCECIGKCGHHAPGRRCPHVAQFHTKVHAFGFCKNPGLDHGFAVHIVCADCMTHHVNLAREMVEGSHTARERLGRYLACPTCVRNVVNLHEIWEARPLDEVI
jgi:hypothetical protein